MTTTKRSILILLGFGLLAAIVAGPRLAPARNAASDYSSDALLQQTSPAASPDLLAYLAFLNEQERIRADAHERRTIDDRRAAVERYRAEVDRRAWQAGMARHEAENLRRRADFSIVESRIRNEAEVRINAVEAELAELRRAAEEDVRQLVRNELAARLEAFSADWDDAQAKTTMAMAIQRADDQVNVEESRESRPR